MAMKKISISLPEPVLKTVDEIASRRALGAGIDIKLSA